MMRSNISILTFFVTLPCLFGSVGTIALTEGDTMFTPEMGNRTVWQPKFIDVKEAYKGMPFKVDLIKTVAMSTNIVDIYEVVETNVVTRELVEIVYSSGAGGAEKWTNVVGTEPNVSYLWNTYEYPVTGFVNELKFYESGYEEGDPSPYWEYTMQQGGRIDQVKSRGGTRDDAVVTFDAGTQWEKVFTRTTEQHTGEYETVTNYVTHVFTNITVRTQSFDSRTELVNATTDVNKVIFQIPQNVFILNGDKVSVSNGDPGNKVLCRMVFE